MKILFVAPYCPYPPHSGGTLRVWHLMRHLRGAGHQVGIVCYADEGSRDLSQVAEPAVLVSEAGFREGRWLRQARSLFSRRSAMSFLYRSEAMDRAIADAVARMAPDVVSVEHTQMGYHRIPDGPLRVMDAHNVEHAVFARAARASPFSMRGVYSAIEAWKYRRDEARIISTFDLVLATSEVDRAGLLALAPDKSVEVVTNGVDTTYCEPRPKTGVAETLVFIGAADYHPNEDGLVFFMERVFPLIRRHRPGVEFFIVGGVPGPRLLRYRKIPGVQVTGRVHDVRRFLARADLCVVPLRIGGGTRIKILEAMASGRAVVSTSVGREGLEAVPGRDLLVADTPVAFAGAVLAILDDAGLRTRLVEAGLSLVRGHYSWPTIGERLSTLLGSAAERRLDKHREAPLP